MKNIIKEQANVKLTGRLRRTFSFVSNGDIENKYIVDIGCGYGWFEHNAFKKGAAKITGIEISESDLMTVKSCISNKNFSPVIGHATNIPVKKGSVDTVVAWEVIEHIPNGTEDDFFKEVRRVLRKDGHFYLSTPYRSILATYLDPAFWLVGHRHYSKSLLTQFGLNNKFSVESVLVTGGIWTIYSIIDMYFWKWIFRRESVFKRFLHKKIENEYRRDHGSANIFVKYKKL